MDDGEIVNGDVNDKGRVGRMSSGVPHKFGLSEKYGRILMLDDKPKRRVVSIPRLLCSPSSLEIIIVDESDGEVAREESERDIEEALILSSVVRMMPCEEEVEGGMMKSTRDYVLEEDRMEEIGVGGVKVIGEYVIGENTLLGKGILKGEGVSTLGATIVLRPIEDETTTPILVPKIKR